MISLLLLGFFIGIRHALEADHLAAVATLATRTQSLKTALRYGALWGLGHTLTLFVFVAIVLLSEGLMPEQLTLALELVVGIMLLLLGIDVIRRVLRDKVHMHAHWHGEQQHFHAHSHKGDANQQTHDPHLHQHAHAPTLTGRALFIGLMHGMAGSAALLALTMQSVTSPLMGLLYALVFGLGSLSGMAVLSVVISIPLKKSARGLTWLHNGLQVAIGLVTIILGSSVIYANAMQLAH